MHNSLNLLTYQNLGYVKHLHEIFTTKSTPALPRKNSIPADTTRNQYAICHTSPGMAMAENRHPIYLRPTVSPKSE